MKALGEVFICDSRRRLFRGNGVARGQAVKEQYNCRVADCHLYRLGGASQVDQQPANVLGHH